MPGRKRAHHLGLTQTPKRSRSHSGTSNMGWGLAFVIVLLLNNCGFPKYDFLPAASAGAGGLNASGGVDSGTAGEDETAGAAFGGGGGSVPKGGRGGGGGGVWNRAGTSGLGGAGVAGGVGIAGEAGAAGAAGDSCVFPAPVVYPRHCFDQVRSGDESGVDCGGPQCAACTGTQACVVNDDCASGQCTAAKTCVQGLSLTYQAVASNPTNSQPKFNLIIDSVDMEAVQLQELRVRYYFSRDSVPEPVYSIARGTVGPGTSQHDIIPNSMLSSVSALVYRTPIGPSDQTNHYTDAYVEVTFRTGEWFNPQDRLVLSLEIDAGTSAIFQQVNHYSFNRSTTAYAPNNAITVYHKEKRLWGVEPPLNTIPDCAFVEGVRFGGPAMTVGGLPLSGDTSPSLRFIGSPTYSNTSSALPAPDLNTTNLLKNGRTLNGSSSIVWSVPKGKYWAFAWLTSANGTDAGTLLLQGNPTDLFAGGPNSSSPGSPWGLLGPYLVEVTDQTLTLSASGTVHVAGLKLYQTL